MDKPFRSISHTSAVQPSPDLAPEEAEICIPIHAASDILEARKKGRELASQLGFTCTDCTLIATAISELARNIVLYAKCGQIRLGSDSKTDGAGIVITAHDDGPGISDVRKATLDGFSTLHGLGLGLSGVRRIMDDFEILSRPECGTTVTVRKWKSQ